VLKFFLIYRSDILEIPRYQNRIKLIKYIIIVGRTLLQVFKVRSCRYEILSPILKFQFHFCWQNIVSVVGVHVLL